MNKELARYFVKLIAENLQFSFNGMGIPSYSCEWLENQLMQGNFDEVKEFIQKRYDELENASKPKRKFRAMTCKEFCCKHKSCENCPEYNSLCCSGVICAIDGMTPYKTKYNKYILIEVEE